MEVPAEEPGPPMRSDAFKERRFRLFEVCIVITVVFGGSIFFSVFPIAGDLSLAGVFRIQEFWLYTAFECASGLALLGYVLCRKARAVDLLEPIASAQSETNVMPTSISGGPLSWISHVSLLEWCLILVVAFWDPLSYLLCSCLAQFPWMPLAVLRNWTGMISITQMAIGLAVLAYVLKQSGRSFRDIGLRWSGSAAALAIPLFIASKLFHRMQLPAVLWLGTTFGPAGWHPPNVSFMVHGDEIEVAEVASMLLVGFYEELIVRAYLMTEVLTITRSSWLAVLISVVVQTSYHFYQGVPLALSHVVVFTGFALFYLKTRSILPVAIAHSLVDVASTWTYGLTNMSPY